MKKEIGLRNREKLNDFLCGFFSNDGFGLKKPEFIVRAISQSSKSFSENTVIKNFKQIEKVWDELFPVEQARIINLLVRDIEVKPEGFNIRIFKEGINSLSNELSA